MHDDWDDAPWATYPHPVQEGYPPGVWERCPLRDEAPEIPPAKMRSPQNTSKLRWVQPMVAGLVIGALAATVAFLSIKNSNDWLPPCAHVQQGACYTEPSTRELGE